MTLMTERRNATGIPQLRARYKRLADDLQREAAARLQFRESLASADKGLRVEFINGEVVTQMSAQDRHIQIVKNAVKLADTYVVQKGLGRIRSEQALAEFPHNDFLPDVCFWGTENSQRLSSDQLIYPPPDLAIEVLSPSTEHKDRGIKFRDYEANGVREYWIIDPVAQVIEQFVLRDERFELIGRFSGGNIRSQVIEGFEIPVTALFNDIETNAALRQILLG